ncbi:MAG TPA: gamma carbonic anhydrase family protein [Ktedonobacterales bacterium]|nr:gamma carbonic anhydrase family protein [Ktedonobacterales bacterium]
MPILPYRGVWPRIAPDAYIAPTATIAGDVTIESQASVWFSAAVRGDTAPIVIGARTNVQDGCVLHADIGQPCVIGADCSLGHSAIVHGATIGDGCLIGMGATVLTGAVVEAGCIVAARALVAEGKRIPAGQLVMGAPGKVTRAVTDAERARILEGRDHYLEYAREYRGRDGVSTSDVEAGG